MSDERPEALLKSALEKIIYFEARSEQLCTDLQQSREEADRLRRELSAAAEREISVRAQLAELEVRVARLQLDRDEQARLNEGLRRERKELIAKLIDASRLQSSGESAADEPELDIDLASFIAELRGEVLGLREPAPGFAAAAAIAPAPGAVPRLAAAAVAPAPGAVPGLAAAAGAPISATAQSPSPSFSIPHSPAPALALAAPISGRASVARHAERFRAQGRLDISSSELQALAREPLAEETLFGFSLRELSAPHPTARIRAAERLRSLANPAAAPALASALHAEDEAPVLVALLEAFAPLAGGEGAAVVVPHLRSPSADVRISALRALLKLDPAQAAPHLSAAMKDPERAVRRRASLLALGLSGEEALRLGEEAGRDADPKVRALGALALGAAGGARARAVMTSLLQDADASVRQAASRSLSRILGMDVSSVVPLDDAQRRREIRRLSALPAHPVTAATSPAPPPPAGPTARSSSQGERPGPPAHPSLASSGTARPGATPERAAAPSFAPAADEALCAAVLAELRISIRGRTAPDMARALGAPEARVEEACALVSARGQAVRRGLKYFVA